MRCCRPHSPPARLTADTGRGSSSQWRGSPWWRPSTCPARRGGADRGGGAGPAAPPRGEPWHRGGYRSAGPRDGAPGARRDRRPRCGAAGRTPRRHALQPIRGGDRPRNGGARHGGVRRSAPLRSNISQIRKETTHVLGLPFPDIDPVAVQIGPLAIRWYALAYIAGILLGWWYVTHLSRRWASPVTVEHLGDFVLWTTLDRKST